MEANFTLMHANDCPFLPCNQNQFVSRLSHHAIDSLSQTCTVGARANGVAALFLSRMGKHLGRICAPDMDPNPVQHVLPDSAHFCLGRHGLCVR